MSVEVLNLEKLQESILPRPKSSHKGQYGHVLIVGGDYGMPGSVRMVGEAALRTGAGLVSVATRPEHVPVVCANRPELMCLGINKREELIPLLERATVIVLGPGLGQLDWGKQMFIEVMETHLPMIIDADGLNLLAKTKEHRDNWILTPHAGEAARLSPEPCTPEVIQSDRITAIKTLQKHWGGEVVLKGAGTLVYGIAEQLKICDAGNPAMATAGMGDVLSGIIAGLLAQGFSQESAARLGVVVHAHAGDLAAKKSQRGILAMDLMPFIQQFVNP